MSDLADFKTSPCRGCGKPIVWAETSDGKKLPLDPRAPIYEVLQRDGRIAAIRAYKDSAAINGRLMVLHFATCPKADEFSGSKKR